MRKIYIPLFFLLFLFSNSLALKNAEIKIDLDSSVKNALRKPLVGMFMEFIQNRINGKYGISAQEFQDRGFDTERYGMDWEPFQYWEFYSNCNPDSSREAKPWNSGYNKRGMRNYTILRTAELGESGFWQDVILDSNKIYDFYIYTRGTAENVFLRLTSLDNGNLIFDHNLGQVTEDWSKMTATIPPIAKQTNVRVLVYTKTKGDIHFDEASLMAADNKYSLRKEFYDLMKELKPKILRFPGGCFADYITWHFEDHIGPKDQRKAPNYWHDVTIQRMDFGLDEYLAFCEELKIEPYLLINVGTGTIDEALNLVEYCNGDITTQYGRMRAENGHPEPYHVIYFEIGNEQYKNNSPEYPTKYLEYYKALKNYDSKIQILVGANYYEREEELIRVFSKVQTNAEFLSWHPAYVVMPKHNLSQEEEYWAMASWGVVTQFDINFIMKSILSVSHPQIKNAPTEYWTQFADLDSWILDSTFRSRSLEAALGDLNFIHTFIRNWETLGPACRTIFLGFYKEDSTSNGGRAYYGTAGYQAFKMLFNNIGSDFVPVKFSGSTFSLEKYKLFDWIKNIPILDAIASRSKDSLYISVINRHISDSVSTLLNIPFWNNLEPITIHEIYSSHFYDNNSPDDPLKITPRVFTKKIENYYTFPPHSYTILAIPISDINVSVNDKEQQIIKFNLLPNPASNEIYFDSFGKKIDYIKIYDLIGNEVIKIESPVKGFVEINLKNLPSGTYLITASIEGNQIQSKFIKE